MSSASTYFVAASSSTDAPRASSSPARDAPPRSSHRGATSRCARAFARTTSQDLQASSREHTGVYQAGDHGPERHRVDARRAASERSRRRGSDPRLVRADRRGSARPPGSRPPLAPATSRSSESPTCTADVRRARRPARARRTNIPASGLLGPCTSACRRNAKRPANGVSLDVRVAVRDEPERAASRAAARARRARRGTARSADERSAWNRSASSSTSASDAAAEQVGPPAVGGAAVERMLACSAGSSRWTASRSASSASAGRPDAGKGRGRTPRARLRERPLAAPARAATACRRRRR